MSVNVRLQHISNYVYKCDMLMFTLEVVTICLYHSYESSPLS